MRRLILSIAFLGTATVASAQQVGPSWAAFSRCWTPVGADGSHNVAANTPRVCVIPDASDGATMLTIVGDSVTDRAHVNANGREYNMGKQGCNGWEKAEFSADGRRLYLRSEQTCTGGLKRSVSGMFAIASNGEWVNVTSVMADSANTVRVARFAPATPPASLPADAREFLNSREMADATARIAAQRAVGIDAVIEASRFVSMPTLEAWISEIQQPFNLDDKTLIKLAEANVSPAVIDMMVAVSNPNVFEVQQTGGGGVTIADAESDTPRARRDNSPCFSPVVDPWAWSAYDPCDPYLRYGYYRGRRFYDPYYGYGYGYYGNGYGYYGGTGTTLIIVRDNDPREGSNHGRMTRDGYKSGGGSSGTAAGRSTSSAPARAAAPKGESSSSSSGSSSSDRGSSGSSSGTSSGSSGSSGGDGGRTATRKPPT